MEIEYILKTLVRAVIWSAVGYVFCKIGRSDR